MATAPIDRKTQIELIETHAARRAATFSKVAKDSKVREVLKKNSQREKSSFLRHDERIAKFG